MSMQRLLQVGGVHIGKGKAGCRFGRLSGELLGKTDMGWPVRDAACNAFGR